MVDPGHTGANQSADGHKTNTKRMNEFQGGFVICILFAQRSVDADIQPGRHRIANALNGICMVIAADQSIMDSFVVGIKGHLHTVQTCHL